ncbi:hypothetical protein OKW42_008417 [Paraburkholderia sp. WC7.3d]|uniref:Transposase n=1 Tax=Paraburkholderia podalyriae TaxID=1938811 RepID=A0ABR7PGL0_9BURK|nr:hypothetical protein [Paraburkholderia podalyriae]MBC8745513.1 hypothetical protein [Paraburkholderia podalyriae]
MLFDDEYVEQARAARPSPVAWAQRSEQAKAKDATRRTEDGLPVHSFRTLLDDLATLTYNVCHTPRNPDARIIMPTRPTPIEEQAFRLLKVNPVPSTRPARARITAKKSTACLGGLVKVRAKAIPRRAARTEGWQEQQS